MTNSSYHHIWVICEFVSGIWGTVVVGIGEWSTVPTHLLMMQLHEILHRSKRRRPWVWQKSLGQRDFEPANDYCVLTHNNPFTSTLPPPAIKVELYDTTELICSQISKLISCDNPEFCFLFFSPPHNCRFMPMSLKTSSLSDWKLYSYPYWALWYLFLLKSWMSNLKGKLKLFFLSI